MKNIDLLKKKPWYKRWWVIALIVSGVLAVVFLPMFIYQFVNIYQQVKAGTYVSVNQAGQPAPYDMAELVDEMSPWTGAEQADIVIVEFGDFNCPRCAEAFPIIRQLTRQHADKIKFYWRNYPVVKESSVELAKGGACAHRQNKFWEFHDRLFQQQGKASAGNLNNIAQQAGLNLTLFENCLADDLTMAQIRKDYYAAESGAVQGTPTFFINGYKIEGALPLETWEGIVDNFLKIYE